MSLYVVGDIQGCYRELMQLLDKVGFSFSNDQLWCVGDIVARGPDSLEALRFFADAPNDSVRSVLGNHDLNLIGVLLGQRKVNPKDKLDAIVASNRKLDWIDWLRHQPLYHFNWEHDLFISHAGLYPWWTDVEACTHASEVEQILKSEDFSAFIEAMFGNQPQKWDSSLSGFDRYRFIVNAFTRMRYCSTNGELDFSVKTHPSDVNDSDLRPWFDFFQGKHRVAFGHWAALMGETSHSKAIGLDTGCVWGNHMTLWDVDNDSYYRQSAMRQ
jgi:bis(5'-nucleosyl)-tetraphosphatase (symmetrical)